jgi:hypothetical protein
VITVEGKRESEHPARGHRGKDNRERHAQERPQRRRAEVHCRLLQAAIKADKPGLNHHRDEAHRKADMREGHGPEPAVEIDRNEQKQ